MSDALLGHGTLFQTESLDSPNTWLTLAEVREIAPPQPSRDAIDASHEQGPNEWRTSLPGMKSAGEVTLTFNFVPGEGAYEILAAELDDELVRSRRIVFPNGAILPFDAFLKSLEPAAPIDSALTATAKFQVSGEIGPFQ